MNKMPPEMIAAMKRKNAKKKGKPDMPMKEDMHVKGKHMMETKKH